LMKVLAGAYQPDGGEIFIKDNKVSFSSTHDAQVHGISIIYQEFNIIPELTVAENIFLGREPKKKLGFVDFRLLFERSKELLEDLGLEVELCVLTHPRKKDLLWWRQVKWLKGGNPYREGYVQDRAARCKTGWWSFKIWANHAYPEAKRLVRRARQQRKLERQRWVK